MHNVFYFFEPLLQVKWCSHPIFYEPLTQNTTHDWQKRCNDLRQRGFLKREPLWVMTFPTVSLLSIYFIKVAADALVTGKISGMNGPSYGRETFSIHAMIHHMNHAWDTSPEWETDPCLYICINRFFFFFFFILDSRAGLRTYTE